MAARRVRNRHRGQGRSYISWIDWRRRRLHHVGNPHEYRHGRLACPPLLVDYLVGHPVAVSAGHQLLGLDGDRLPGTDPGQCQPPRGPCGLDLRPRRGRHLHAGVRHAQSLHRRHPQVVPLPSPGWLSVSRRWRLRRSAGADRFIGHAARQSRAAVRLRPDRCRGFRLWFGHARDCLARLCGHGMARRAQPPYRQSS